MLTGQGTERVAVQALKMGAQDYLIKNRAAETVKYVVHSMIEKAALSRQIKEQRREQERTAQALQASEERLPAVGRAGAAGERGAIPAAGRRRDGLCDRHARPRRPRDPLERRVRKNCTAIVPTRLSAAHFSCFYYLRRSRMAVPDTSSMLPPTREIMCRMAGESAKTAHDSWPTPI